MGLNEASEDFMEQSSSISSESNLETSTVQEESVHDITSIPGAPVCASSPQTQSRSSHTPDPVHQVPWNGFKIVGDNIDKAVKPRYMRESTDAQSLHYFHSYAVKDRLNLHGCSDVPQSRPQEWSMEMYQEVSRTVLPTSEDHRRLDDDFSHIVTRIIVERLPFFQQLDGKIRKYIPHSYSKEMSQKSEVVSGQT